MLERGSKNIAPVLRLAAAEAAGPLAENVSITGVAFDSREVKPGYAFVCLPGEHTDGNEHIGQALANGASCIFSEKLKSDVPVPYFIVADVRLALAILSDYFFDSPSLRLRPLAITGTNGKTTTSHLVEHILNQNGLASGLIGTLGARWPGQTEYQNVKHTTPQSADLHETLADMVASGCTHVSMEVSSHALAQKRVAGCHFASACLTNVTQDHLDFHQTMEQYWQAKRKLFYSLNDSLHENRTAIVNLDDPLAEEFLSACGNGIARRTYSWGKSSDMRVRKAQFGFSGSLLELDTPDGPVELKLQLTGKFNAYNIMAALLICLAEGVSVQSSAKALEDFAGVCGRFEVVSSGEKDEPLCIVDYAHTPDGLDNVLKAARNLVPQGGTLVAVFGCGGDRDASKRPQMGEIAEARSDVVIVTSDNPRSEDPQQIIANILTGIKRINRVQVEPDRSRAIRLAVAQATEQDVIVIAGKGHENYQILSDRVIPFDDRTEVQLALKERARQAQRL